MRNFLFLSSFCFLLMACGLFNKEEEEKPSPRGTRVVGEITSVHPEQGFVLFKRYGPGQLLTGGLLSSRSLDGKRAADLKLSPEKLGRFYTADYAKGIDPPREGDVVVLSKEVNDTEIDNSDEEKTETEELEVKKENPSSELEILDNTASQGSR